MLHLTPMEPGEAIKKYGDRFCFPVDELFESYYKYGGMSRSLFPFAKRVIKEIDNSDLIAPFIVESPVFKTMPIDWISTGAKNLILISSDLDLVYSLDFMGENCFPLLFELAKTKEIYATIALPDRLLYLGDDLTLEIFGEVVTSAPRMARLLLLANGFDLDNNLPPEEFRWYPDADS